MMNRDAKGAGSDKAITAKATAKNMKLMAEVIWVHRGALKDHPGNGRKEPGQTAGNADPI